MDIKRTSGPPAPAPAEAKEKGIAKDESNRSSDRAEAPRRAGRANSAEAAEDLERLKAAVSGYKASDLNDAAKTKEIVDKVAKELVENGTRSLAGLTGQQKAVLTRFAGEDPVLSAKILSFVREQVG